MPEELELTFNDLCRVGIGHNVCTEGENLFISKIESYAGSSADITDSLSLCGRVDTLTWTLCDESETDVVKLTFDRMGMNGVFVRPKVDLRDQKFDTESISRFLESIPLTKGV